MTFEEELAKDVLEIITVFSARLYGSRSNKNKKLLEEVNSARRSGALAWLTTGGLPNGSAYIKQAKKLICMG